VDGAFHVAFRCANSSGTPKVNESGIVQAGTISAYSLAELTFRRN
jgi:hypothetical protein